VELHGGTVRAESEGEGRGATFVVRLPVREPLAGVADGGRSQIDVSE
jgi:signal transduction histidine kinase